jgi:hypothetical protein
MSPAAIILSVTKDLLSAISHQLSAKPCGGGALARATRHKSDMAELSFDNSEAVLALLAEQLAEAPLYSQVTYIDTSNTSNLPETIKLFCEDCKKDTNWETYLSFCKTGFSNKEYKCRNCKRRSIVYHYYWAPVSGDERRSLFFKIGQWPALEERIPGELKKNLGRSSLSLYYRALRCRNQNLGLGSLVYLRRVVEDKINTILDMIAEEASLIGFAKEDVAKVAEIKARGLFKDKIDLASVILPPSLRPGGHNPIDALHDLVSEGIHRLSEDECIQVFDKVRAVLEYLFREIDTRRRSAAEYAASVAKLASARK